MADESSKNLDWAEDIDAEEPEPLPTWARQNGFKRTGRSCTRCNGEVLERREISYTAMTDSYIMVRCENFEQGCGFEEEISPGFDGDG